MKTAIIYRSFLGTTKQYATWLAEDIGGEVLKFSQAKGSALSAFDAYAVMSGTYCSWMPLVSFLKKNWEVMKGKKIAVVAVGIVPNDDQGSIAAYERIPAEIRSSIKYFKLAGKMGGKIPEKIPATMGPVARENIRPVVEYLK